MIYLRFNLKQNMGRDVINRLAKLSEYTTVYCTQYFDRVGKLYLYFQRLYGTCTWWWDDVKKGLFNPSLHHFKQCVWCTMYITFLFTFSVCVLYNVHVQSNFMYISHVHIQFCKETWSRHAECDTTQRVHNDRLWPTSRPFHVFRVFPAYIHLAMWKTSDTRQK